MVYIFATTDLVEDVKRIIDSEARLSELVFVFDILEMAPESSGNSTIINARGILQPIDWHSFGPPYLLSSPLPFNKDVLLGLVFSKLGNWEKTEYYLKDHALLKDELELLNKLQYGYSIDWSECSDIWKKIASFDTFDQYRLQHNAAIVMHYGYLNERFTFEELENTYLKALDSAPNGEYKAFSIKHFAALLLDLGALESANTLLQKGIKDAISDDAKFGLKAVLSDVLMKKLTVPYDQDLLSKLKDTLWETLQYFEQNGRDTEAGMLYVSAAHIANISESFTESLGYITKAIRIFEEEELEELAGNAELRKGTLLYTWAQNGNPQFYKPAIESYQRALKVFTKEDAPDVFADIHHHLAVLYAEMPDENKKRGIWAGIATASFQEALDYYTKEQFPYEYGMICNNYGNALIKFPQAVHSDNFEKALFYYQEALHVRTPQYPYERAITLLNFLEASWNVSNETDAFNALRYDDMVEKTMEIKSLVQEKSMLEEAEKHLELLAQLKASVTIP